VSTQGFEFSSWRVSGCPKCWGFCGYSVRCICNYLSRLSVIYWVTFTMLLWSCICNLKDMFPVAFLDVQHPSSHQWCGYVQDAVALSNDCPLWRCLYALGVDALACTVRSWMKFTLTSLCSLNEYTIEILDWLCLLCARILISWPGLPVWKQNQLCCRNSKWIPSCYYGVLSAIQ
jgi:hypothetical protein